MPKSDGERLQAIRKKLGKTQTAMAAALSTTLRSYQRWEADVHRTPPLAIAEAERLLAAPPAAKKTR